MAITIGTVTRDQIRELEAEAIAAGDEKTARVCNVALQASEKKLWALAMVVQIINENGGGE